MLKALKSYNLLYSFLEYDLKSLVIVLRLQENSNEIFLTISWSILEVVLSKSNINTSWGFSIEQKCQIQRKRAIAHICLKTRQVL